MKLTTYAIASDTHATSNWRYAFGGIDNTWLTIDGSNEAREENARLADGKARVKVEIEDEYAWHPDEFRTYPCLHTAMENCKFGGAADFTQVGNTTLRLKARSSNIPVAAGL